MTLRDSLLYVFLFPLSSICFSQNVVFDKVFPISGVSISRAISVTTEGSFLICGVFNSGSNYDMIVIKADTNGDTIWTKLIGGNERDGGQDILQTIDKNIAVLGTIESLPGKLITSLSLLNDDGDLLWGKEYPQVSTAMIQTHDSGFALLGTADSNFHLIRTNSSGDTLWVKNYGSDNILNAMTNDEGFSLVEASNGDILLAGYAINWADKYAFVIRLNQYGDTIWAKLFSVELDPYLHMSITGSDAAGYAVAGSSNDPPAMKSQVLVFKIDSLGNLIWHRSYGGSEWDKGNSIIRLGNNGYAVTGVYENEQTNLNDVYILRYNGDGDTLWTRRIGGNVNYVGYDIAISDCSFFVLGNKNDGTLSSEMCLIKLTGACDTLTSLPENRQDFGVTINPNPANESVLISVSQDNYPGVIKIYDIHGKTLLMQHISEPKTELNLTKMLSGIYTYKYTTTISDNALSGKIVIEK